MNMKFKVTVKTYHGLTAFTMQAPSFKMAWNNVWDVMRNSGIKGTVVGIKPLKVA